MRFNIIAVGNKMPSWINTAFLEYAKRMPREFPVALTEIPAKKRSPTQNIQQCLEEEGQKILASMPSSAMTIALDEQGEMWDTLQLAKKINNFQNQTSQINFLIGGADGLSKACLQKANIRWSLSLLTFPHPIVRIILIEQLYRAISILNNHPYHRA